MSHIATNWAWSQTLHPATKLVLMAICDCHNAATGQCNPSYDYIAERACVSSRTVIRTVQQLVDEGYISLLKSRNEIGQQRTNTYVLNMGNDTEKAECQNVTPPASRVTKTALPGDTVVTQYEPEEPEVYNNIRVREKTPKRGTRVPENFEPDNTCWDLANSLGLQGKMRDIEDSFLDYWRGVPGSKGVKLDWQATFRNQLRHISKQKGFRPNGQASKPNTIADNFEIIKSSFAAERERIAALERAHEEAGTCRGVSGESSEIIP